MRCRLGSRAVGRTPSRPEVRAGEVTDGVQPANQRGNWWGGGLCRRLVSRGCTVPSVGVRTETPRCSPPVRCLSPREVLRDQVRVAQLQRHVLPPPRELGLVRVGVRVS